MSQIIDSEVVLSSIVALSKLNPRQDLDGDVSTLAATITARGLLHPILVKRVSGAVAVDDYEVLAGGRRWRALISLGDDARMVPVKIFQGSDAEAREAALAEAVTQKPLHPVEEFEAFRDLADAGMAIEDIARDFALDVRRVKQRLALGRLSNRVLTLWREDTITKEIAAAFTAGTIEAQEALLDEIHSFENYSAYRIRRDLRDDVLGADSPIAKFLLADNDRTWAYSEAGGRIEESLFTEETLLLDGALARKTADRLLLAEAERIMESEGWGAACIAGDDDEYPDDIEPDCTEDEESRLDEIEAALKSGDGDCDKAELYAEQLQIETRALLRAVSTDERAKLGVRAEIIQDGSIEIIRGVPLASANDGEPNDDDEDEEQARPSPRAASAGESKKKKPAEPPAPEPAKIGKALKSVLDEAVNEALQNAAAGNINLSLVFSVAALGCSYGRSGIGLSDHSGGYWRKDPKSPLLRSIRSERFEKALLKCLKAPLNDLSTAFAELVARSIDVSKDEHDSALILIDAASRLSDIRKKLAAVFDYEAYFEANPRDVAIEAIRKLSGQAQANDSGKLKKPELVARAARLAKDMHWLPDDFDKACGASEAPKTKDTRSTAKAMRDAIEQDEAKQSPATSEATGDGAETRNARIDVEAFIELNCFKGNDALDADRVKASELYESFVAFCELRDLPPIGVAKFSELLAEIGIEKKRLKNGVHYLNLRLIAPPAGRQAAE